MNLILMLDEFLDKRNVLAHHLDTVWSLENSEGMEIGRQFINRLLAVNAAISEVFLALVHTWQTQVGSSVPPPQTVFSKTDGFYQSLARSMFFEKEPGREANLKSQKLFHSPCDRKK